MYWVFEPMVLISGITADSASKTEEFPFNPETVKLLMIIRNSYEHMKCPKCAGQMRIID
ncbi:MAG: hypothetical protein WCP55_24085 [Lentisphaerota bacterium]